ncbi:MAG: DrmB family protein [Candidatus Ornithomonoglobus sp.]
MYNVDKRADIDSLIVQCTECKATRRIRDAFSDSGFGGYRCTAYHPHLLRPRRFADKGCNEKLVVRLRSSSGIYFPVVQSALSIPPWSRKAIQLILRKYRDISHAADKTAYIEDCVLPDDGRISLEELLHAYELVNASEENNKQEMTMKNVFFEEYLALSAGTVQNEGEYAARETEVPEKYNSIIDQIVAIDKLTVISALCGFTRLTPWSGSSLKDQRIAPLSMEKKKWLPGIKLNGEGVFIKFNSEAIDAWEARVGSRYDKMKNAYENSYMFEERFSERFVLLHTISHMLIRQLAAECGYNAASMKERIYCTFGDAKSSGMSGILIYLASSDSEGSLGGLTSIAENAESMENIIDNMLRKALWCSGDPICINSKDQAIDSLNYSACYDCVLLPEVSCESRNVFLDRVSVVGKPENRDLGLFGLIAENMDI